MEDRGVMRGFWFLLIFGDEGVFVLGGGLVLLLLLIMVVGEVWLFLLLLLLWMVVGVEGIIWMVDRLGLLDVEGEEGLLMDWGGVDILLFFMRFLYFFFSYFFNNSIVIVKVVVIVYVKNFIKN